MSEKDFIESHEHWGKIASKPQKCILELGSSQKGV